MGMLTMDTEIKIKIIALSGRKVKIRVIKTLYDGPFPIGPVPIGSTHEGEEVTLAIGEEKIL